MLPNLKFLLNSVFSSIVHQTVEIVCNVKYLRINNLQYNKCFTDETSHDKALGTVFDIVN